MDDTSDDEPRRERRVSRITTTKEELAFRTKKFGELADVLQERIVCSICGDDLKAHVASGQSIECHPHLEVLLCKGCREFYGLGEFSPDEDGSDKYCRWCGQGGRLFCCSKCVSTFCQKCLKKNLHRRELNNLDSDDWECLMCNPKPIFGLRAVCDAAMKHARQKKHDKSMRQKGKLEHLVAKRSVGTGRAGRRSLRRHRDSDSEQIADNSKVPSHLKLDKNSDSSDHNSDQYTSQKRRNSKVLKPTEHLNESKVKKISSFEFSDSDFEPKSTQKQHKVKLNLIQVSENELSDANSEQKQSHKHKKEPGRKEKYESKGHKPSDLAIIQEEHSRGTDCPEKSDGLHIVLDALVDDVDCVGHMLTERAEQFRRKYFSDHKCPENMIPLVEKKLLRLVEVSIQSLTHVMKDLSQLGQPKGKRPNSQQLNKTEDALMVDSEDDFDDEGRERMKENVNCAEGDMKRCGSMTSDDDDVVSSRNEVNENSVSLNHRGIPCEDDIDPSLPIMCNSGELDGIADAADDISVHSNGPALNQSLDLFDDDDVSGMKDNNTDDGSPLTKHGSVCLSADSLALKTELLKPSSSDTDSENCTLPKLGEVKSNSCKKIPNTSSTKFNKQRKPRSVCSNEALSPSSSESESSCSVEGVSKKVVNFDIKELAIYRDDIKLQGSCKVIIERMDKAREQEYLARVTDYYENNASSSGSDDSVNKLTNLNSLRRWKRADLGAKSAYSSSSKDSEKKSDKGNKLTLKDFYGQSDADDASETEDKDEVIKREQYKNQFLSRNEQHKAMLLMSSSDSEDAEILKDSGVVESEEVSGRKSKDPCSEGTSLQTEENDHPDNHISNSSDCDSAKGKTEEKKKSNWRQNRLLTQKLSESDTSDDERKWKNKQSREETASSEKKLDQTGSVRKSEKSCKSLTSDSDVSCHVIDSSSSEDFVKRKRKRPSKKSSSLSSSSGSDSGNARKKKIRRRIKVINSSSDEESSDAKKEESPNKGRKKIRRVIKEEELGENTKAAAKEEEERRKRIAERNKKFNEMYENRQKEFEVVNQLVLDFDEETKQPLVEVNRDLVKKLKPHQAEGVKFMWDACFESIERIKRSNGSGCILAHCMGLGKTLQVITLLHTLFNHPETKVHTALIVCPLSTVLNWVSEFDKWLNDLHDTRQISIFELTRQKQNYERQYKLKEWQEEGGVLVIGYEMYRNLCNPESKRVRASILKTFLATLVDPGPDIVVCDEGHLLKNEDSAISKAMSRVKTMRRIVLTGTPLQNNLKEYHCMVQFVKPNLLGTRKEFLNRFVNPITNGQFEDSTSHDVRMMKRRAHVLHKTLEGSVQRFDYSVLTPFLPDKQEYVISIRLTELQETLYKHFLDNFSSRGLQGKGAQLFNDFQQFQKIWTHPRVLKMSAERNEIKAEKKRQDEDSEGSLRDFIDDDGTSSSNETSSQTSTSDDDIKCLDDENEESKKPIRKLRSNKEATLDPEPVLPCESLRKEWWEAFVKDEDFEDIKASPKLTLLFSILKECEETGDKLLVFSQSLFSLDLIEYFLGKVDEATQNDSQDESINEIKASWVRGIDYFRLDGQTPTDIRSLWCKSFNNSANLRGRLFLISTRAGGLGINLVAANRVIIFDASWNPSHDVQSIFRVYRFGQKKPCFIYRFLAQGTMEEKIYERQVTKLSLACRVVDEQQIERHYNMADLQELYRFNPADRNAREKPKLPKDGLFAEILKAHEDLIISYHEHDSLLENKADEELNEEERQAAWEEYENEKKGKVNIQVLNDNMPTPEQLLACLRIKDPGATEEQLQIRCNTVYQQMLYARQKELLKQQQMQMLQQAVAGYRMGTQPQQYPNPHHQAQYMAYQVPMPNPAFQPINSVYGSYPSTSNGSTGTNNLHSEL